jgi:hypothetical protein
MSALPIAQWQAALDQMETTLAHATRALARAEERWERAGAPSAGEGELPLALDRVEARLRDWDARLRAAEELTGAVEKELTERAAAVGRWCGQFARWEELIKRTGEGTGENSRGVAPPGGGARGEPAGGSPH